MRHFRHLTEIKKREIYVGYLSNEPKLVIAKRLQIDNATVHYHIHKIKELPRSHIFALIAPKCSSGHTALKCLVCGKTCDNIKSDEFQEIVRLRRKVQDLERQISTRNETAFDTHHNPIVRVSG